MKNIIWIAMLFLAVGCFEDKNDYDYKNINELVGTGDARFKDIEDEYICYPEEEVEITPKVKFTIDSINPDISYEWYVGSELYSREQTLKFSSAESGIFKIVFAAVDNKTEMKFFKRTTIVVKARWENGWMILSETPGGESQLSMVLTKIVKVPGFDYYGRPELKDSITYIGEDINTTPGLGLGPKKLVEHFSSGQYVRPGQQMDEVFVLQKDKAVALHGEKLTKEVYADAEFLGPVPAGFEPEDAVFTFSCKCLLDKSGYIYLTPNSVPTQFHASFYPSEPAYGGEKFSMIVPVNKQEASNTPYFLAVSRDSNALIGIIDNASLRNGDDETTLSPFNEIGARATVTDGGYDMSLFKNLRGNILYMMWEDNGFEDYPWFVSLLNRDGKYYTHNFAFRSSESNLKVFSLAIKSSFLKEVNPDMFTDFVDATVFPHKDYMVIANGNNLYYCSYKEDTENEMGTSFKQFPQKIAAINCRDFYDEANGGHLGVALEDGSFYVYEMKVDPDSQDVALKELYSHTGFGKVKDVAFKFYDVLTVSD